MGCAAPVMRAQAASGPGRTRGAEHHIHGLTAHLAGDRGDLVLTGSRRLAGATAARRRGPPVPRDAEDRWHAPDENGHVGPAAAHAVRGTPDALAGVNDHRNEPGAHIETARLPLVGDGVHREPGHRACLVPVLRRRKAKRHGPGSAGRCCPGSGRTRRARVRRGLRFRPRGGRGRGQRPAPAPVRRGGTRRARAGGGSGVARRCAGGEHRIHRPAQGGEQSDAHGEDENPASPVRGGRDTRGPGARAARRTGPSTRVLAHIPQVCEAAGNLAEGSPTGRPAVSGRRRAQPV